jgi:hypothetical protein
MAVTQISRIQHRRGLEQDLPQLSSAELGWSIDTRQLYIGNGTIEEGAPIVGVTRILTEHDVTSITSNTAFASYTFVGNAAGYTAQTGPSALVPVVRNYQQKFDDIINIRDFGAVGDDSTDDTAAINRALQQIYKSTANPTEPRARRTIYFPGGSYLISNPILIPPYAKLIGDGINSVIIRQSQANRSVANICDSSFQTATSLGSGGATLPQDIEIHGIQFLNSNISTNLPIFVIDSANNVRIQSCEFKSNVNVGFYPNLVSLYTTTTTTSKLTFDSCQFIGGGNGIGFIGSGITSVRVTNSVFDDLSNVAVNLNNSMNFVSIGNYFGNVGGFVMSNGNNRDMSIGDYYFGDNPQRTGINFGNLQISSSQQYSITSSPLVLTPVANTASKILYEIKNDTNIRIGTFTYTKTPSNIVFDDSYVETGSNVGANLFANANSILVSVADGSASFKFNFQTFI